MTELFPHASWLLAFLDIALVSFVVYRLLLLFKERIAVRILLLLALLILLHFFSQFFGLRAVTWILTNFLGSFLLILVVVFQSDIRRVVLSLGKARAPRHEQEETPEAIEEVVTAVESLASRRIGALIVFERDMPLGGLIAVGTELDAKLTSELISSIFLPYSPIHDGAVIVQRGKLTRAGCFLPLTQSADVAKHYGTRHRAAIGLSELVDAVVLVVSEETGRISVVTGGRISEAHDPAALRKTLRRLLEPRWLA